MPAWRDPEWQEVKTGACLCLKQPGMGVGSTGKGWAGVETGAVGKWQRTEGSEERHVLPIVAVTLRCCHPQPAPVRTQQWGTEPGCPLALHPSPPTDGFHGEVKQDFPCRPRPKVRRRSGEVASLPPPRNTPSDFLLVGGYLGHHGCHISQTSPHLSSYLQGP